MTEPIADVVARVLGDAADGCTVVRTVDAVILAREVARLRDGIQDEARLHDSYADIGGQPSPVDVSERLWSLLAPTTEAQP